MKRLSRDRVLVECCLTSNFQTGAAPAGRPHPIWEFLEHGIPVAIYTVDKPRRMRKFIKKGVDAIFTNHPDRMLAIVGEDLNDITAFALDPAPASP